MTNDLIAAHFDVSPSIIRVLGEELIHDKKIAIAELVKNAYDADATQVKITLGTDKIIIEDDGCGMNVDIIKNYWLKTGSSNKRNSTERTQKFKRLPIGEKGIGRLGVHRLGSEIEVISKMENHKEVVFSINWKEIENKESLKDIAPISITQNEQPNEFTERTGTKLIIKSLKESFDKSDVAVLQEDLQKLLSPFQRQHQFEITLHTSQGLFMEEEELNLNTILARALFNFDVHIEKKEIVKFDYKYIFPDNKKYPSKNLTLSDKVVQDIINNLKKYKESQTDNSHGKSKLGKVEFQGYIFEDKLSRLLKAPLDKPTKKYLKENGGIRVYRDGIRIYNYGEGGKDNDILNLDRKRAKKLGDFIGYNQILAAIELDSQTNKELKEKSNREGFIHNAAFDSLVTQLDFCMEVVMHCRKRDKAELISLLEGKDFNKDDIDNKITKIIGQIDKLPIAQQEKKKLHNSLYEFSKQFKQIKDVFLTAANTGLNLTFIVHEIDKIISHLEQTIKKKNLQEIERVFWYLKKSLENYKDIIRIQKKSSIAVSTVIKQAIFYLQYRFDYHIIEVVKDGDNEEFNIAGKQGLIIGVISNIFDNAIYWLKYYEIEHKKIFIKTYSDKLHHNIVIADNAKGFNISFEAALMPFITGRIDETSMGIGLHLATQVMEAHQGAIEHGDWEIEELPEEFARGAIIKLTFPKEQGT